MKRLKPHQLLPLVVAISVLVIAAGYQSFKDSKFSGLLDFTNVTNKSAAIAQLGAEPALGNPSTNGYVLSSTAAGARSWAAPAAYNLTVRFTVANQAARYALTGLVLNDVVKQTDTTPNTYWKVINAAQTNNSAGWVQISPVDWAEITSIPSLLYATNSEALLRLLQSRADLGQATARVTPNILENGQTTFNVRNGTKNADGTITIPANDYVNWNMNFPTLAVTQRYFHVAATTAVPSGSLGAVGYYANSYGGNNMAGVATEVLPGVMQFRFTNSVGDGSFGVFAENKTAAPITIFPPVLSTATIDQVLLGMLADNRAVASQPVADLDYLKALSAEDRTGRFIRERQTTIAVDSVSGLSGNAGTLYAPKLSLAQTLTAGSIMSLYRGSLFRESLPLSASGSAKGIVVQDVGLGSSLKALPIVSSMVTVPNGSWVSNGDGTYSYTWTPAETLVDNGYELMYAVEVNTATEATTPVASRRGMKKVASQALAVSTVGSVYVQSLGGGQWKATIHPSDNATPGTLYRYEVNNRSSAANWILTQDRDVALSGLQLVGPNLGYGSIGGPSYTVGDRLILTHGTTHHAVIAGGSLNRTIFYDNSNGDGIAWYRDGATGKSWEMRNVIFYAGADHAGRANTPNFVICHNSFGSAQNFDRADINDTAFIGGRLSDGSLLGAAISMQNANGGLFQRLYIYGVSQPFSFASGQTLLYELKDSVLRQVGKVFLPGVAHDNIIATERRSNPATVDERSSVGCEVKPGQQVYNNLFWIKASSSGLSGDSGGSWLNAWNPVATGLYAQRNIVILDNWSGGGGMTYATFNNGSDPSMSIDYNLVIQTGGPANMVVAQVGGATLTKWTDYVTTRGYDTHSLFIDLRNDPRGIKAIFVDPANGDFRWAQTDVAQRCADYCKLNNVGPARVISRWPTVPTVDEAARIITNL